MNLLADLGKRRHVIVLLLLTCSRATADVFLFPASTLTVYTNPSAIAVDTFNDDQAPDIAVAYNRSESMSMFTNDVRGGFFPAAPLGYDHQSVIAADMNRDGLKDLIVSRSRRGPSALINNGRAQFSPASSPNTDGIFGRPVSADINRDGHIDVLAAEAGRGTVTVWTNNGTGDLSLSSSPLSGLYPTDLVVADFNRDGRMDVISANFEGPALTLLINNGVGGFASGQSPPAPFRVDAMAAGDINDDGWIDIVLGNVNVNHIAMLTNNGAGAFALGKTLTAEPSSDGLGLADFDNDQRLDLLIVESLGDHSTLTVHTNSGNGFAVAAWIQTPRTLSTPLMADVNSDGRLDLITASGYENSLSVIWNVPRPFLLIERIETNVRLRWPSTARDWRLEMSTDLSPGASWEPVSGTTVEQDGYIIFDHAPPTSAYFRLGSN